MKPLTIVVSFDEGEQVVPRGIPSFVAEYLDREFRGPLNLPTDGRLFLFLTMSKSLHSRQSSVKNFLIRLKQKK
jgi:hypothetical protein